MKAKRCPWCGEYVISFWDRMRVSYRHWGKCKKCGQKWCFSLKAVFIILPALVCMATVSVSSLNIWLRLIILLGILVLSNVLQAIFIPIVKKEYC